MSNPIEIPIILPINVNPMVGQIGMEQLHLLGLLLVVGFVLACSVIVWKALQASNRRRAKKEARVVVDRREVEQAAPGDVFAA
jgi:prolipoprotein diacylglyceryltransferase